MPCNVTQTAYGLTPRLAELLSFIEGYVGFYGYSPTYREMMEAMGLRSKSRVHAMVHELEERGHVRMMPNAVRSVVPTEERAHG